MNRFGRRINEIFVKLCFLSGFFQGVNLFAVCVAQEYDAQNQGDYFGDREGPPNGRKTTDAAEDIGDRQQDEQLTTEIHRLSMPWPNAWKKDEQMTLTPASRKLMLIMRSAGTPISSILSEALKKLSIRLGASCMTAKPRTIIRVA